MGDQQPDDSDERVISGDGLQITWGDTVGGRVIINGADAASGGLPLRCACGNTSRWVGGFVMTSTGATSTCADCGATVTS